MAKTVLCTYFEISRKVLRINKVPVFGQTLDSPNGMNVMFFCGAVKNKKHGMLKTAEFWRRKQGNHVI